MGFYEVLLLGLVFCQAVATSVRAFYARKDHHLRQRRLEEECDC